MRPHRTRAAVRTVAAAVRARCRRLCSSSGGGGVGGVPLPLAAAALVAWTAAVLYVYSWWLAASSPSSPPRTHLSTPFAPPGGAARRVQPLAAVQLPTRADSTQEQDLDQQLLAALDAAAVRFEAEHGGGGVDTGAAPPLVALEMASSVGYDPTNVEPDDSNRFRPFYQKLYADHELHPDNCTHGPHYISLDSEVLQETTIAERCHVCERVYRNSLLWNWKWHYNALCNLVPAHLQRLCYNYACVMASSCPEFITATCSDGDIRLNPCPAKVVCWNCLKIPRVQTKGCFDGTAPF